MSYDWNTNRIKPLHEGGDVNNVNNENNYRAIIVGRLPAKLCGCIVKSTIRECLMAWHVLWNTNGIKPLHEENMRKKIQTRST